MNKLPILVRREFWENRNIFLVLPAAIVAFNLLMYLFAGVVSTPENATIRIESRGDVDLVEDFMVVDGPYEYALLKLEERSLPERERAVRMALMSVAGTLFVVLWFVVFFYLLNSLYTDRRDRSVLFWKSLPVSDAMTVGVKLVTGVIIVPLIYLVGIIILQLTGLLVMTFVAMGTDVSASEVIWRPAAYPLLLLEMLLVIPFLALWHLPLFGWLMAVSAFARSVPLVWATGVPVGLVITEAIVTNGSRIGTWIGHHAAPIRLVEDRALILDNMFSHVLSLEMLSAIIVGGVLMAAAVWLRGKADEI